MTDHHKTFFREIVWIFIWIGLWGIVETTIETYFKPSNHWQRILIYFIIFFLGVIIVFPYASKGYEQDSYKVIK